MPASPPPPPRTGPDAQAWEFVRNPQDTLASPAGPRYPGQVNMSESSTERGFVRKPREYAP